MARPLSGDRSSIVKGDRVLLAIEDDEAFDRVLLESRPAITSSAASWRCTGQQGLSSSRASSIPTRSRSTSACRIWTAGWCSISLKHTPATRHIPVHIISALDEQARSLEYGAHRVPASSRPTSDAARAAFDARSSRSSIGGSSAAGGRGRRGSAQVVGRAESVTRISLPRRRPAARPRSRAGRGAPTTASCSTSSCPA